VSEVTQILDAIGAGSAGAHDLLPLVYDELRRLAAARLANEQPGQTLQPTALVHEAWLRLTADQNARWSGRGHFFAAAAEAMRRILIDNARRKNAQKRGAGAYRIDLDGLTIATETESSTLLLVNEALELLAKEDAESAQVVKLRFFLGLNNQEAAQVIGVSERTVKRQWAFARAWLYDQLRREMAQNPN